MSYFVVRFDDGGATLTKLSTHTNEDAADVALDRASNRFPNAYIDILTDAEYRAASVRK